MSEEQPSVELRILRAMRRTLTNVAKDTYTPPGMRHPLSEDTINDIRECLVLIASRENELGGMSGDDRPHFTDEMRDSVLVQLDTRNLKKKD
ncbi:MAG TPA: segregation and condensation protein A [Gammaproteobacteria bacterium]|nr:segregation and condensation protein A [Gammaproteobacteria bacterium]